MSGPEDDQLAVLYMLGQREGVAELGVLRELAPTSLKGLQRALDALAAEGFLVISRDYVTTTTKGDALVAAFGFMPWRAGESIARGWDEPLADPCTYLPREFRRGGDDLLRSERDGESPSGG